MLRKILVLVMLVVGGVCARAQVGAIQGYCNRGGQSATISGLNSSNKFQNLINSCTISIYQTGTNTLVPGNQIFSNATGTVLGNPFTADSSASLTPGKWLFFISITTAVDVYGSGGIAPNTYSAPVPLCIGCFASGGVLAGQFVSLTLTTPQAMAGALNTPGINGILNAALYPGADIGAQVDAAYAALPSTGGEIYVPASSTCYSYTTPIVFATNGKPVTFRGAGQPATCLHYTGTTGVGITLNTGVTENQPRLEDFSLIGSGVGNATTGITFGGSNASESASWTRVKVENFGLGAQYLGVNTFIVAGDQIILKNNGQNFLDTAGQENNRFINSTFALDTPGTSGTTANSVQISGGADFLFVGCSFDNVQLALGTNETASIVGGHFENPASGSYNYFVMAGNTLNLTNALFLQDNLSSFPNAQFGAASAGTVNVYGGQYFDPTSTAYFVGISSSASVNVYGLTPDSATPGFITGTTSGRIVQAPDASGNFIVPDALVATGNVTAKVNLVAVADILDGPAATLNNSLEQSFNQSSPGSASNCAQWQLFGNSNYFTFCGNGNLTSPALTATTLTIGANSVTALPASAIVGLTDTQALTSKTVNGVTPALSVSAGTSAVNQALCQFSAGPPMVIGHCTSVVGSGGACTCAN